MAKNEQNSSTGLVMRGGYVEWTTLRRRKGRVEIEAHERADAGLDTPVDLLREDDAQAVYKTFHHLRERVSISIPSHQALLRVVDLPSSDPEELEGMVELQVDKFAPFQLDRLKISYEVLSQTENGSRVLIVAVKLTYVEAAGHPFLLHRRSPDRVDIEVMGWWRLLKDHGDVQDSGRQVFLLLEPSGAELIFTQDGQPAVLRTLGGHSNPEDDDFIEEVAEETHYTLTSMEAEWGALHTPILYLWHWGETPGVLCNRLESECGLDVRSQSFDDLPPLSEGLARRFMDEPGALDLSLDEWSRLESARALRKRMLIVAGAVLSLWLVGMSALTFIVKTDEPRYNQLLDRVTGLEEQATEVRQLKDRLDDLEQYADRTYSSLECLRELSLLLPSGVEWESFSYKKDEGVDLRGKASSADPVYDYVEALERSDLFTEVTPDDIRTRVRQGQRETRFKLEALLPGGEE